MSHRRVLFLSHGGGPLPLLGDKRHAQMVSCLTEIATQIEKPSAILVISAHWEGPKASVTAGEHPDIIYDYYGFPEESYRLQYPCPGHPELAAKVHDGLAAAGLDCVRDKERGFDHGLFVPLTIMFPDADIPCVQLSLLDSLDPESHLRMGEALRNLESENLLVIGSGFSFHNMQQFFAEETEASRAQNEAFDAWLRETCTSAALDENARRERLVNWEQAPGARFCHPREEHLLPLHVCYGMAGTACQEVFELKILAKKASMMLW